MISDTIEFEDYYIVLESPYERDIEGDSTLYIPSLASTDCKYKAKSYSYKKRLKKKRNRIYRNASTMMRKRYIGVEHNHACEAVLYTVLKCKHKNFKLKEAYYAYLQNILTKISLNKNKIKYNSNIKSSRSRGSRKELVHTLINMNWYWLTYKADSIERSTFLRKRMIEMGVLEEVRHKNSKCSLHNTYNINKELRPTRQVYKMYDVPPIKTYKQFLSHVCGLKRKSRVQEHVYVPVEDVLADYKRAKSCSYLSTPIGTQATQAVPVPVPAAPHSVVTSTMTSTEAININIDLQQKPISLSDKKIAERNLLVELCDVFECDPEEISKSLYRNSLKVVRVTYTYSILDFNKYFLAKMQNII